MVEFFSQCPVTSQGAPWKKPAAADWLTPDLPDSPDSPDQEEPREYEFEVASEADEAMLSVKNRLRAAMPEVFYPMAKLGVDDNAFCDSQLHWQNLFDFWV